MNSQELVELETAAQVFLAPPNLVNNEQRHAAEAIFLRFRKTRSPYVICKFILETSHVDYVLFEAAGVIKTAIIQEWRFLQEADKTSLREYLLNYVVDRVTTLPIFVREKILQVIAIMIKRESVEDVTGASVSRVLDQVENMVVTGDHSRQILGCNLITSTMLEFAITFKSSDVGLPWEDHFKSKKMFQDNHLKKTFQFCCRALGGFVRNDQQLSQHDMAFLKSLVVLSESILSWNFVTSPIHPRIIGVHEAANEIDYASLKVNQKWTDVILDPQVVDLFFMLYWRIRSNPQLAHHGMTCLVQLGSLNGRVFTSKEARLQYMNNFLRNLVELLSSTEILDREALGISNVIFKLLLFHTSALELLPRDLMESFLEQMTKLTCDLARGASSEESMCIEDRLYMEGFDKIMEAWLLILFTLDKIAPNAQSNIAQQLFYVYTKLHLAPPDGARGDGRELETEELEEHVEVDRIRFRGQLQTIGAMGRLVPHQSLPLLATLMEDRIRRFRTLLQKMHQQTTAISDNASLLVLFEDIHWLVLISGHVLSMHAECETSTVPMELMMYSINQSAHQETSQHVFGSPQMDIKDVPNAEQQADHVIRLVTAIFRLANTIKESMEAKMKEYLSPELSSTVLWFLNSWSATYLLLDEELYTDLSPVLLSCHGRDSEGGVWASQFLFNNSLLHLLHFHSEPSVLQDAVQLLISLVQNRDKRNAFVKSESLVALLEILPQLPIHVKRGLYKVLTVAGMAVIEGSIDNNYWVQMLLPLQDRFKLFINREGSSTIRHSEAVKSELLDILECFIGVANGTRSATVPTVYSCLAPIMSEMPPLLGQYNNYQVIVEAILMLHCDTAKCLVPYLTRKEVYQFYNISLQCINTYAEWNKGRLSLEADAQDDTFEDVSLLIELLTDLLSKDLLDLAPAVRDAEADDNSSLVTASEVALSGLQLIMPLMTHGLLKYPQLCLKYFKLLYYLSDTFPERIIQLPDEVLKNVLSSVELGLTSFGQEITIPCCDLLQILATRICRIYTDVAMRPSILRPFLKLLVDLILSRQINPDNVPNFHSAMFALICCYPHDYEKLVQQLIATQTDPHIAQRLANAFNSLTDRINLIPSRPTGLQFSSRFSRFVVEVHGFLHIM